MTLFAVIVLAVIQGLTEFLPVSSSGHLVLGQHFLAVQSPGIVLEVVLHMGTLVSVIIVFFKDIVLLLKAAMDILLRRNLNRPDPYRRLIPLLVVGTIPAALAGIFLDDLFESLFAAPRLVGFTLLLTAIILLVASRIQGRRDLGQIGFMDAVLIGVGQSLAITPGISRSGTTIATALSRGLDRDTAVRFSFLLAIPAIGGAGIVKIPSMLTVSLDYPALWLLVGAVVSALSGIVAILWLVRLLKTGKLQYFAYYVLALSIITLTMVR